MEVRGPPHVLNTVSDILPEAAGESLALIDDMSLGTDQLHAIVNRFPAGFDLDMIGALTDSARRVRHSY